MLSVSSPAEWSDVQNLLASDYGNRHLDLQGGTNSDEARALYAAVIDRLAGREGFRRKEPPANSPLYYSLGHKNTALGVARSRDQVRVELYLDEGDREHNRTLMTALRDDVTVRDTLGEELLWTTEGNSRKCTASLSRTVAPEDGTDILADWAADWLARMRQVFYPRLTALRDRLEGRTG